MRVEKNQIVTLLDNMALSLWSALLSRSLFFFKNRIMNFSVFFKKSLFRSVGRFNLPVSGKRFVQAAISEWMNCPDNMKRHNRHRRTP